MVEFISEVYYKDEDDIVGVEVIVTEDDGEINSIQILNKTEFEELVEDLNDKLDALDETYVQFAPNSVLVGSSIETILENTNENVTINATKLGGFQSDQYTKTGHTHGKTAITDLYNYDISLSEYNPNVGETVTVTVKVTKQDGAGAVTNVIVKKNDVNYVNGSTNNNGVFTFSFTPDVAGLITFSCGTSKVQCLVNETVSEVELGQSQISAQVSSGTKISFRKLGKIVTVTLRGSFTVSQHRDENIHVCNIPEGYVPSKQTVQAFAQRNSNGYFAATPEGKIIMYLATESAAPTFNVNMTYIIN